MKTISFFDRRPSRLLYMMIIIQQIKHIPIKQLKQNIFKLVWRDCSVKIGNLEYNTPSVEPSIKKYLTLRRLLNEKKHDCTKMCL